jgi:menaquinone-dependent protoporphyrinogen oxidase
MSHSILITYATKHGSTRQVAETIAVTLEENGLRVVVELAADVHGLDPYDAVVLGTALYMGRPHADARRFLKRHHGALAGLPVAVFAMGPLTTGDGDVEGAKKQLERALAKVSDVSPVSTAIFGGVVDPERLRFPFNHMEASDARDWGVIEAWAREIATLLLAERVLVPVLAEAR